MTIYVARQCLSEESVCKPVVKGNAITLKSLLTTRFFKKKNKAG